MAKKADDIKDLSFEKALAELEEIVRKLETGEAALEESIALYERGAALKSPLRDKAQNGAGEDRENRRRRRWQSQDRAGKF